MDNIERLHTALNALVPTGREQVKLTEIRNLARVEAEHGKEEEDQAVAMLTYVLDGLRWANW